MYPCQTKRLRWTKILCLISAMLFCCMYQLSVGRNAELWTAKVRTKHAMRENFDVLYVHSREVGMPDSVRTEDSPETPDAIIPPSVNANKPRDYTRCIYIDPLPKATVTPPAPTILTTASLSTTLSPPGKAPHIKGDYPQDLFTLEQRRHGWILLHIIGMTYMFVALAIVCDEFFVPALGIITEKLQISDDVAGATFMAAGGSAPELFTSLIGVFISHSNVGIGTIVGSAVFNLLFVIGMCAIFSHEMLSLTWWPLFRDVSFYILILLMLIIFFLDSAIAWWESILLLLGYVAYVSFMKYNAQLEWAFKAQLHKHQSIVQALAVEEAEKDSEVPEIKSTDRQEDRNRLQVKPSLRRGASVASLHNRTLRNTIYHLMLHTLNPLGEGLDRKNEQPNAISVQVTPPAEPSTSKAPKEEEKEERTDKRGDAADSDLSEGSDSSEDESNDEDEDDDDDDDDDEEEEEDDSSEDESDEPLSLDWPDTRRKQATYLFLLPIVFPLWLTVPDVRRQGYEKYFFLTFLGSIVWIGIFSYLMVWWAHQVGETIGISEEIMGLTILAAGTSIPDLITSVIVARKGLGDMAVSSSVGSNIFDITVGLPVPWLLYSLGGRGQAVPVRSNGLFCAIVLLFLMLICVIFSIISCRWKMNKKLGFAMFLLYFLFLLLSVLLEERIIPCPVSV